MAYQNIIVAVDLSVNAEGLVIKAAELAALYQARLTLVHIVDYLPVQTVEISVATPVGEADSELSTIENIEENSALDSIRQILAEMITRFNLSLATWEILVGTPKVELIGYASKIQADLIVIGSHDRHGLGLLLGSTASAVLHRATCDVLAVRLL